MKQEVEEGEERNLPSFYFWDFFFFFRIFLLLIFGDGIEEVFIEGSVRARGNLLWGLALRRFYARWDMDR